MRIQSGTGGGDKVHWDLVCLYRWICLCDSCNFTGNSLLEFGIGDGVVLRSGGETLERGLI